MELLCKLIRTAVKDQGSDECNPRTTRAGGPHWVSGTTLGSLLQQAPGTTRGPRDHQGGPGTTMGARRPQYGQGILMRPRATMVP